MQNAGIPLFLTLPKEEQKSILEALIFASDEPLTYKLLYKILIPDDGKTAAKKSGENALIEAKTLEQLSDLLPEGADTNEDNTEAPVVISESDVPATASSDEVSTGIFQEDKPEEIDEDIDPALNNEIAIQYNFSKTFVDELVAEINAELHSSSRPYRIVDFADSWQFRTLAQYGEAVQSLIKAKTKKRLSQAALECLAIIAYKQPITKPEIEQIRGVNSNEVVNALIEKNLVKIAGRKDVLGKPLTYGTTPEFLRAFGVKSILDLPKLKEFDELAEEVMKGPEEANEITLTVSDEDAALLHDKEGQIQLEKFEKEIEE